MITLLMMRCDPVGSFIAWCKLQSFQGKDFYADFAAAFERNARWSSKKHVPKLGDDSMARDRVDK